SGHDAGRRQRVDPTRMTQVDYRSCTKSRVRCSLLRSNAFTAAASAAFSFGASIVPRYWARFLMRDTRQLRSLAAAGLCLGGFFMDQKDRASRGGESLALVMKGWSPDGTGRMVPKNQNRGGVLNMAALEAARPDRNLIRPAIGRWWLHLRCRSAQHRLVSRPP